MSLKLKQHLLALATLVVIAVLIGCASISSKTTDQESVKPATTIETKTGETINKGNNNVETKTVEKTTIETKDGEPRTTTYESSINLTASSGDKVGVPECDEYIEKYEACIKSKVPQAIRQMIQSSFEQTRKQWKDAAANPQAKAGLATGCKQAREASKQAMTAYGCAW